MNLFTKKEAARNESDSLFFYYFLKDYFVAKAAFLLSFLF